MLYYLLFIILFNKLYNITYLFLETHYTSFKSVTPTHKKWYVVSNLVKSFVLGIFSPLAIILLYQICVNDIWDHNYILFLGGIYASLDLVAIMKVPKMAKTTLYHHIIVNVMYYFLYINYYNDFSKLIVVYAIFSTIPFLVNFYLGFRVFYQDKLRLQLLASVTFFIYISCCFFNWSYQFYNILWKRDIYYTFGLIPILIYFSLLFFIIKDDLIFATIS